MGNTQAADIIKEGPDNRGQPVDKTQERFDTIGSTPTAKLENFYKLYFRKLIDSQLKSFGSPLTKRTNITHIGPPEGVNPATLVNSWKERNPGAKEVPGIDQISANLIYEKANLLLDKYAKEAFGESKEHYKSLASNEKQLRDLRNREGFSKGKFKVEKDLEIVRKEIADIRDNIERKGSFSEFGPKNKNNDPKRLAELENAEKQLTVKLNNIQGEIQRITAQSEAMNSPTAEPKVDSDKLQKYVLAVLNVSANQEVEQGSIGSPAKNQWPNDSKRPPLPASPEMGTIHRYEQAIALYAKDPSVRNSQEVGNLFREIEENAAPIFADFFGINNLHLEGVVDPTTNESKFPYLQLMNILISKLIEEIHNLAKKSELVKRELITATPEMPDKKDQYTDISGNVQKVNRSIASLSGESVEAFHKLFTDSKFAHIGMEFSRAEIVMEGALQKNLSAIKAFLKKHKPEVLSLANSLGNKISHYAAAQPDPRNDYSREFEVYGLEDLEPNPEDKLDPKDPASLAKKSEDIQFLVRQASHDILAKWALTFKKIPPAARPFDEIEKFMKLASSRFSLQKEADEAFETTQDKIKRAFFSPALFFLVLVDHRDKLNAGQDIEPEEYIRSDWGKHFRAYMGAQKLNYTSPREDLSVLLEIGRFMREGFISQQLADEQLSDLGRRVKSASELQPREVTQGTGADRDYAKYPEGSKLVAGDRNALINSREFLDNLKESAPNDYSYSIFQKLIELKTFILNKKLNKEFEAAKAIQEGPYAKAKADVITILSPILRDFLFERYSQDTRLIETVHLFYALLREFETLIDKYDPEKDGDVENWLLVQLNKFDKSEIVRAMHGGADRLWYIPQDNDQIKGIMESILDIAEIRKHKKSIAFNSVRRLVPLSKKVNKSSSLVRYVYADDTKKDANGKSAYDRERERATPVYDRRTGKTHYEVIDKGYKSNIYFSIEPKDSLIRNPEEAERMLNKIYHTLTNTFWKNLDKIGFNLQGANITNPNAEKSGSSLDQYYWDQLHRKLSGYNVLGDESGKKEKGKSVVEPIAAKGKDKQNLATKTDVPEKEDVDIDNKIMELLTVAGVLFDAININEEEFMSKVDKNLYANISNAYKSQNTLGNVRAVVSALFQKDWNKVHQMLFMKIGKGGLAVEDSPDTVERGNTISTNTITQDQRSSLKEPLIFTLGTILATSIHIIRENANAFKDKQRKSMVGSNTFKNSGVEELYSGYSRVLDSLKELLASAFLHKLGTTQPMRGFPQGDRGAVSKGRKGPIPFNHEGTTSIRHPFTLHKKWARRGEALGEEYAQNQDPTSDTRQLATMAMLNAQNRFLYNLQQYEKKKRGEEVGKNEGDPVKTDDLLRTLGNSIDGEVGSAFGDAYRSRRFAGSSWKNGDMDVYHNQIRKALKSQIEALGYRVDRPEWFEQNKELQAKAVAIVETSIKQRYIKGVDSGGSLAGPGNLDDGSGRTTGKRDRELHPDKYAGKEDLGVVRGNSRGVTGPSNPLHKSGINPDARLMGDQDPNVPSIYAPDYSSATQDIPVTKGFAGNTDVNLLTAQDKERNAALRLQQFIELYPQFLEAKALLNVSMFESQTEDSLTLEDLLGDAATAENSISLETALSSIDYHLDEECFSRIGSKKKKIFKTPEDAISGKNGEDKFVPIYKDLGREDTKLINTHIENLGWAVISDPFTSKDKFRSVISNYDKIESNRDTAILEILFVKYFEYIYIREVVMAETILYLADITETNKTPEELKREARYKELERATAQAEPHEISKIQSFINESGIHIKHVPGIEFKFVNDAKNRIPLSKMIEKILENVVSSNMKSVLLKKAHDLVGYITGAYDTTEDSLTTYGQSKKSTAQTDIHGMEVSTSSKQEQSAVSDIDKKAFELLNVKNVKKIVQDVLSKDDDDGDHGKKLTYDEVRSTIRNLVTIYNSPVNTGSGREEIDWYISNVKSSVNKLRNYLHPFTKSKASNFKLITKIEDMRLKADEVLRYSNYDRESFGALKKLLWSFLSTIYDLPLGEEEDFSNFSMTSPREEVEDIFNVLQKAENAPEESWNAANIKVVVDAINKFGRALKEGRIEVVVSSKGAAGKENKDEAKERAYSYLVNKGSLLDTVLSKLKTKLKKGLLPIEVVYEVSNYLTQINPYISAILKSLPPTKAKVPREPVRKDPKRLADPAYDPFEDDSSAYSDKKIISDLEKQAKPSKYEGPSYGTGTDEDPYRTTPEKPKKSVKKESKDFEPFKRAITVQKIIKCVKTQAAGMQKLSYAEYGNQYPAKLSRVLFELSKQEPFDVDNYRVFITDENKSKVNIVFEYRDQNRGCAPDYMWVVPKRTTSSN